MTCRALRGSFPLLPRSSCSPLSAGAAVVFVPDGFNL
jgi:hypothetical protein